MGSRHTVHSCAPRVISADSFVLSSVRSAPEGAASGVVAARIVTMLADEGPPKYSGAAALNVVDGSVE